MCRAKSAARHVMPGLVREYHVRSPVIHMNSDFSVSDATANSVMSNVSFVVKYGMAAARLFLVFYFFTRASASQTRAGVIELHVLSNYRSAGRKIPWPPQRRP